LVLLFGSKASAVILYNGDNTTNQTAPASGAPFYAVARVCNSDGSGTTGSAVYISGKYMLTANHVGNRSHVTFDGSTFYARDTAFTPQQIAGTNVDMKLIKLIENPGLNAVSLNTNTSIDIFAEATLIGWGVGRDTNVADTGTGLTNIWAWGNTSTLAKRWGTNNLISTFNAPYGGGTYSALVTALDRNGGSDEAGATIYDSGSGIFILDGSTWKLAGVTTSVSNVSGSSTSTFGNAGDYNYFVRMAQYASQVTAAIPDPQTYTGWKIDYSLYNADANDDADPDSDGIENLLEFALGGNPGVNNRSILPVRAIAEDSGSSYLELSFTRPKGLSEITYTVQTTTELATWPADGSGVNPNPVIVDNGNGTETLTYRRTQAVDANARAFIRLKVTTP
jgi:hypothetical protein